MGLTPAGAQSPGSTKITLRRPRPCGDQPTSPSCASCSWTMISCPGIPRSSAVFLCLSSRCCRGGEWRLPYHEPAPCSCMRDGPGPGNADGRGPRPRRLGNSQRRVALDPGGQTMRKLPRPKHNRRPSGRRFAIEKLAHPTRFERVTSAFGGQRLWPLCCLLLA